MNPEGKLTYARTSPRGIKRRVRAVLVAVNAEISAQSSEGRIAAAMATEGYRGGYADALRDVLLALDGIQPDRRGYWK